MIIDIVANALLLVADAAILIALSKRCRPSIFAALVAAAGLFSLLLAAILGGDLFGSMRVLAWAIFVHGVIVLAGGAILLWKPHRNFAIAAAAVSVLIGLVGVDAFFVEPYRLEVTRIKISSPKLGRPLKIVVLADLQTDVVGDYELGALDLAMAENPDVILFAGDYIQEPDEAKRTVLIRRLREFLRKAGFAGPKASMAVEGNCDSPDWPTTFQGLGIAWTKETRTVREGDYQLTALSLEDSFNTRLSVEESNLFHIVLGHAPDYALGNIQADLLLAGHTHGGQVRLPGFGPLVTLSRVPRSWAAGATSIGGGRTLVVSRGIGMERGRAPRLRFLCRPQLVVVEAVPGPRTH